MDLDKLWFALLLPLCFCLETEGRVIQLLQDLLHTSKCHENLIQSEQATMVNLVFQNVTFFIYLAIY